MAKYETMLITSAALDEEEGVYTVINFTSEPSFPAELDRVYKITEGVMRSLIIAHEE